MAGLTPFKVAEVFTAQGARRLFPIVCSWKIKLALAEGRMELLSLFVTPRAIRA